MSNMSFRPLGSGLGYGLALGPWGLGLRVQGLQGFGMLGFGLQGFLDLCRVSQVPGPRWLTWLQQGCRMGVEWIQGLGFGVEGSRVSCGFRGLGCRV